MKINKSRLLWALVSIGAAVGGFLGISGYLVVTGIILGLVAVLVFLGLM